MKPWVTYGLTGVYVKLGEPESPVSYSTPSKEPSMVWWSIGLALTIILTIALPFPTFLLAAFLMYHTAISPCVQWIIAPMAGLSIFALGIWLILKFDDWPFRPRYDHS